MQSSTSQTNTNDLYAEQWIKFLRRRNVILNVVWPILLILLAISCLGAIYYYQLHLVSQQELKNIQVELGYVKSEYGYLQADFEAIKDENDTLNAELEALKTDKASLSEQQSNSVSKLDLSNKMLSALKQKVTMLQSEKNIINESTEETKALLLQQKRKLKGSQTRNKEMASNLNKQLSARKTAYQALAKRQHEMQSEIDRLLSIAYKKEAQIELISSSRNSAQKKLQNTKQQFNKLKKKYAVIEKKLKLVISPITNSQVKVRSQGDVLLKPLQPSTAGVITNGLEEIKRPLNYKKNPAIRKQSKKTTQKKSVKNSNSAAFDYDKITIN